MAFDPVTLGAAVQLAKDPATIKASVEDWLDDHPEATTTVEDGSITKAKLHDDLAGEIDDNTAAVAALEDDVDGLKSALNNYQKALEIPLDKVFDALEFTDISFTNGGYINTSGIVSAASVYMYSDYIDVIPGTTIDYSLYGIQNTTTIIAAYDKNKLYKTAESISNNGTSASTGSVVQFTGSYIVPDDILFIRVCCNGESWTAKNITIPYQNFKFDYEDDITGLNSRVGSLEQSIIGEKTLSLADLSWESNSAIKTDGTTTSASGYRYSDYIEVEEGQSLEYDLRNANNVYVTVAAFDSEKVFKIGNSVYYNSSYVSGAVAPFTGTYTVPTGIKYVIICYKNNESATQTISIPTKYDKIEQNTEDIQVIQNELTNHWQDKKWVAFGTSITDNYSEWSYIDHGEHQGEHTGKYVPYLLTLSQLSNSTFVNRGIAGGKINGHILYYLRYYTSDMANANLITIEGAVNDFASSIPLGDVGDTVPYTDQLLPDGTSEGTFAGACYQAFTTAITNAPNAVIVLLTETTGKNDVGYVNYSQTRLNSLGLTQDDYIQMTIKVAKFVGIPVIECGSESMINAQNPQYIADHIHHTYLGGYQYARTIWAKLKGIPLKALALPE